MKNKQTHLNCSDAVRSQEYVDQTCCCKLVWHTRRRTHNKCGNTNLKAIGLGYIQSCWAFGAVVAMPHQTCFDGLRTTIPNKLDDVKEKHHVGFIEWYGIYVHVWNHKHVPKQEQFRKIPTLAVEDSNTTNEITSSNPNKNGDWQFVAAVITMDLSTGISWHVFSSVACFNNWP